MQDLTIKRESGEWEVIVGMEVHAQISSKTKLFSHAPNDFSASQNTNVAWLDVGFPGQLPVLNEECVRKAALTGMGVKGNVEKFSVFDRKGYFYPDLPLGYQISQYYHPIVKGGVVEFFVFEDNKGYLKTVNLERIHIEQDAGKSIHDLFGDQTALDFNRAGVGLMEIVTKPEIYSAEEAMACMKMLRCILRYLDTCDTNMEEGNMRADVNISVRPKGDPLGTRVEIKNLNSIRYIGQVIQKESLRQIKSLEKGVPIEQTTCLYNPKTSDIFVLRRKEDEADYRYFPDPNIPAVHLSDEMMADIRQSVPELPIDKMKRYRSEYGIGDYEANILAEDLAVSRYFESAVGMLSDGVRLAREVALWLVGDIFAKISAEKVSIGESRFTAKDLSSLVELLDSGKISRPIAKELVEKVWETQESPISIVEKEGLEQVGDDDTLRQWTLEVLAASEKEVAAYKAGKVQLKGFFVGQVMKKSQGKADPKKVNLIISEVLEE